MSNFHEAADAIRRIAKTLEGFKIAADALESVGSVDQAAKEAQAARDAAVKERAAEVAKLSDVKKSVKQAQSKAAQVLEDAHSKALDVAAKAEADATASAQVIFNGIVAQANAIESDAKSKANKLTEQIEHNAKVVAGLKDEVERLDISIAAKQAQLNELTAALDTLKSKLA